MDADPSDDLLIDEREYVVSYNARLRAPNWVAWRLDASDLGHARRHERFRVDSALPVDVYHVTSDDYLHSGFDRGHLCPSADRTATGDANAATFLMTNILPQVHDLNAGPWEQLEERERELARAPGAVLYLVAGGIFDSRPFTIGNAVSVPRATWKVAVALRADQTAVDVNRSTMVLAVVMPNEPAVARTPWETYATSVDEVERRTGYDFLRDIPDDVEGDIEARVSRTP